jgi:hypothetical protein
VQAKFAEGSSVLGSSQLSIKPLLPPKIMLNSKLVKINLKIIISLRYSKSVTHSVIANRKSAYLFETSFAKFESNPFLRATYEERQLTEFIVRN